MSKIKANPRHEPQITLCGEKGYTPYMYQSISLFMQLRVIPVEGSSPVLLVVKIWYLYTIKGTREHTEEKGNKRKTHLQSHAVGRHLDIGINLLLQLDNNYITTAEGGTTTPFTHMSKGRHMSVYEFLVWHIR